MLYTICRAIEQLVSDGGETNIAGALELTRREMLEKPRNGKRSGPPGVIPNPGIKELVIFITDGVVSM